MFGTLLAFLLIATYMAVPAFAVHDTGVFQLDGDAATGTNTAGTPSALDDWDKVCHEVTGTDCSTTSDTSGANAVSWTSDNLLNGTPSLNATIFTGGGSKDPQDISNWAWKDGAGGLPDKDNLLHSFAARYSATPTMPPEPNDPAGTTYCPNGTGGPNQPAWDPTKPCDVLFFGSDRYDNSGDAQQGFWFFQNPIGLTTTSSGGGFKFSGVHKNGDLLIISDFSNGGTTSTITVYAWDSSVSGNLRLLQTSNAANCATAGGADAFCGIVNPKTITMPWSFTDKSGTASNGALNGEFYEGGVNLSDLGLSAECFSSVASETRSSTSTTATLKDFVLGNFGECTSKMTTTPKTGTGGDIPAGGLSIGTGSVSVADSADLQIKGIATWSGTLKFFLCDPTPLSDSDYTPCTSGGTQIGSDLTVDQTTSFPLLSTSATVTKAGRYCWRGEFTHTTTGVPDVSDASKGECFSVNPVTPTLTTTASDPVVIGNPISDTAHLGGTANQPGTPVINPTTAGGPAGGTITFKVYGPDDATCSNTPAYISKIDPVSGNGDYVSSAGNGGVFTPTSAGTYRWTADYSGDPPNTNKQSTACNDANESVVVSPKQPTIKTQVNHETTDPVVPGTDLTDTATLGNTAIPSNGKPGTITFTVYGPEVDASTCTTVAGTSTVTVNGSSSTNSDGDYTSGVFNPSLPGYYNWVASYAPDSGDVNNKSAGPTGCGDAHESSFVRTLSTGTVTTPSDGSGDPLQGPLDLGTMLYDKAVVTGDNAGGNPPGTVTFYLCDPTQVKGAAGSETCPDGNGNQVGSAVTLTPDQGSDPPTSTAYSTPGVEATLAGTWCFRAEYTHSGAVYTDSEDASHGECVTVNPSPTKTVTTPSKTSGIAVGDTVTDHAVVTGVDPGGSPTGDITFYVCDPTQTQGGPGQETCGTGGTKLNTATASEIANSSPPQTEAYSDAVTATKVGVWCFRAEYAPGGANGGNYTGSYDGSHTECFTVTDTTSGASVQNWLPNDHVTISSTGGTNLNGTLDITLRKGTCDGTVVYTEQTMNSPAGGWASGTTFDTSNTDVKVNAANNATPYFWRIVFTSSDQFVGSFTKCERTDITINDNP